MKRHRGNILCHFRESVIADHGARLEARPHTENIANPRKQCWHTVTVHHFYIYRNIYEQEQQPCSRHPPRYWSKTKNMHLFILFLLMSFLLDTANCYYSILHINVISGDKPRPSAYFAEGRVTRYTSASFKYFLFLPLPPHPLPSKLSSEWGESLTGVRVKGEGVNIALEIPRKWVLFVCEATCASQWYPIVYNFSHGVKLCFDVRVPRSPCCSPPTGSLWQLFSRQLLSTSNWHNSVKATDLCKHRMTAWSLVKHS